MNSQTYHMNDHVIEEKDLGVIVDDKLKFHMHTSTAIKYKILLPSLYISMVRPHLEYGNNAWGPHFKGDMKAIERVQKRATKMIPPLKELRYTERLQVLDLHSLEYRRKRSDMIMYYKTMTGKVEINRDDLFRLNQHSTRDHRFKLDVEAWRFGQ